MRLNRQPNRQPDLRPVIATGKSPIKTGKSKGALFTMAVSNLGNEDALRNDGEFLAEVRKQALKDPDWTLRFLRWLRSDAYIRTASIIAAAQAVHARLEAQKYGGNRQIIAAVLQRGDEPGEMLSYYKSNFGTVPSCVKRGIGDAMIELGTEFTVLKYDSERVGFRFRDILNLVHAGDRATNAQVLKGSWQHDLFDLITKPNQDIPASLPMMRARKALMAMPVRQRRELLARPHATDVLHKAGMTWEALAGWIQGPMDAQAWESVIPLMSYTALLRNLRNFDQAGVSDEVARTICDKLGDPAQVARSKQFPMRILSAYRATSNLRWAWALERALTASLANIQTLPGETLIMVDTSHSMEQKLNVESELQRWDAAILFGAALAARCEKVDLVSFSADDVLYGRRYVLSKNFPLVAGESVLKTVERWKSDGYFINGNTQTAAALVKNYVDHDRVIVLTDDQPQGPDPETAIPASVPMYTWNLAGVVRHGAMSGSDNRHQFAGLTDAGLKMIPMLEAHKNASWPF